MGGEIGVRSEPDKGSAAAASDRDDRRSDSRCGLN
jgi:hypothetical protein